MTPPNRPRQVTRPSRSGGHRGVPWGRVDELGSLGITQTTAVTNQNYERNEHTDESYVAEDGRHGVQRSLVSRGPGSGGRPSPSPDSC